MKMACVLCRLVVLNPVLMLAQVVVEPTSNTSSAPIILVQPLPPTGSSYPNGHLLDLNCHNGDSLPCVSFSNTGGFTFTGNTASYGTLNQSNASMIQLYGGTPNQAYLQEFAASINSPGSFSVGQAGGGSLSGTYWFEITYVNAVPGETVPSAPASVTLSGAPLHNAAGIPAPLANLSAYGYQIYYSSTQTGTYNLVPPADITCTTNGSYNGNAVCAVTASATVKSIASLGTQAPTANTTGGVYSGYWFVSGSVTGATPPATPAGVPCFSTTAPTSDCAVGSNTTVLMKNPMTNLGDIVYGGGTPEGPGDAPATVLAADTSNTKKFLTTQSSSGNPQAPQWLTIAAADVPSLNASIITTGQIAVAQGGTGTGTLTSHGVVVGQGTSAVHVTSAGTAGQPFVSGGPSADPSFTRAITTSIPSGSCTSSTDCLTSTGTFATSLSLDGTNLAVGSLIEVRAHGVYTTTATSGPMFQMQVNAGGTSGICILGAAIALSTGQTNGPWDLACYIQINTTGSPGTAIAWGSETTGGTNSSSIVRVFNNTGTQSFTTGNSQTVSIQETATLVSGQSITLQAITARVLAF